MSGGIGHGGPGRRREWQRSSFSGGGGESCVELARDGRGLLLRESDVPPGRAALGDAPTATMLRTTAARLAGLFAAIRGGRFDGPRPAGPTPS